MIRKGRKRRRKKFYRKMSVDKKVNIWMKKERKKSFEGRRI